MRITDICHMKGGEMNDLRLVFKNKNLDVDLAYGLNLLNQDSASGKTYFSKAYTEFNADFMVMSLSSERLYDRFIERPWNLGFKDVIYFFGRFDYFKSKRLMDIILKENKACILMDLKKSRTLIPAGFSYYPTYILRVEQDKFEVKNGILQRR